MSDFHAPFVVTGSHDGEEPPLGEGGTSRQQSELQAGEIRRPGVHPPTPLMDWGRGDSLMWDSNFGGTGSAPEGNGAEETSNVIQSPTTKEPAALSTPLNGFGRGDDLWGVSPTTQETQPFPVGGKPSNGSSGQSSQQYANSGSFGQPATFGQPPSRTSPGGMPTSNLANYSTQQPLSAAPQPQRDPLANPLTRETTSMIFSGRTQSQVLSDELYFQAQWFPPPPPPKVPKESRRSRSELWYYYASKWDITHSQPPPPRCPLSLMEEEYNEGLQPLTKVPYRGEYWLDRCAHWAFHMQQHFHPPENHAPHFVDTGFILDHCVSE